MSGKPIFPCGVVVVQNLGPSGSASSALILTPATALQYSPQYQLTPQSALRIDASRPIGVDRMEALNYFFIVPAIDVRSSYLSVARLHLRVHFACYGNYCNSGLFQIGSLTRLAAIYANVTSMQQSRWFAWIMIYNMANLSLCVVTC